MPSNNPIDKTRTEYEQLEYQRTHPDLFTTMSQSVNPDGSLTTFDSVTAKMKKTLDAMNEAHTRKFGGSHPNFCVHPIMWQSSDPICASIELLESDMSKVRASFVSNYRYMHERIKS